MYFRAAPQTVQKKIPRENPRSGAVVTGAGAARHQRPVLLQERVPDLLVRLPFIDERGDLLSGRVRRTTTVGVATGQRVEVPRAGVLLHRTGAVGTREEPLDPLVSRARPTDVRRVLRGVRRSGFGHLHVYPLARLEFGRGQFTHHEAQLRPLAPRACRFYHRLDGCVHGDVDDVAFLKAPRPAHALVIDQHFHFPTEEVRDTHGTGQPFLGPPLPHPPQLIVVLRVEFARFERHLVVNVFFAALVREQHHRSGVLLAIEFEPHPHALVRLELLQAAPEPRHFHLRIRFERPDLCDLFPVEQKCNRAGFCVERFECGERLRKEPEEFGGAGGVFQSVLRVRFDRGLRFATRLLIRVLRGPREPLAHHKIDRFQRPTLQLPRDGRGGR